MNKNNLILLSSSLVVVSLTALTTILIFGKKDIYTPGVNKTVDSAVAQSRKVYNEKKKEGIDFTNGPCLSNDLISGWVLDLVHNPRLNIDDLKSNQCAAFLEGRAKHFIEMDLKGNIVRVK